MSPTFQGRTSRVTVDALGRVVVESVAGLEPVRYTSQGKGRLLTLPQEAGVMAGISTVTYSKDERT